LKKRIRTTILVAAVLIAATFKIYAIREGTGALAIWNPTEAYMFAQVDRRGDTSSHLLFPWILFKEYVIGGFVGAVEPNDGRAFLVVFDVRSASVVPNVVGLENPVKGEPGTDPSQYASLDGRIYATCSRGLYGRCRWAGDHFERSSRRGGAAP
jgi:hypothetical protein